MTGTSPSTGTPRNCSTSAWVLSVLSSASITNARPMPVPRPSSRPSSRFCTGLGRTGDAGTIARSSTRTLLVFIGPVMSISFCRLAMTPYIFVVLLGGALQRLVLDLDLRELDGLLLLLLHQRLERTLVVDQLLVGLFEGRQHAVDLLLVGLADRRPSGWSSAFILRVLGTVLRREVGVLLRELDEGVAQLCGSCPSRESRAGSLASAMLLRARSIILRFASSSGCVMWSSVSLRVHVGQVLRSACSACRRG